VKWRCRRCRNLPCCHGEHNRCVLLRCCWTHLEHQDHKVRCRNFRSPCAQALVYHQFHYFVSSSVMETGTGVSEIVPTNHLIENRLVKWRDRNHCNVNFMTVGSLTMRSASVQYPNAEPLRSHQREEGNENHRSR
jgi:hypothetical protein